MPLCALFLAAAAAAASSSAAAEDPPALPSIASAEPAGWTFDAKHNVGVQFVLPGGTSPEVGVTYFVADSVAARFDFGLDAAFSPSGVPATFDMRLGLRFYRLKRDRVAVFIEPSFAFGRAKVTAAEAAEFLGFGGAVGVEYFFTDHFSAGAELGLQFSLTNIGGNAATSTVGAELSTGTSGLFAQIYF